MLLAGCAQKKPAMVHVPVVKETPKLQLPPPAVEETSYIERADLMKFLRYREKLRQYEHCRHYTPTVHCIRPRKPK